MLLEYDRQYVGVEPVWAEPASAEREAGTPQACRSRIPTAISRNCNFREQHLALQADGEPSFFLRFASTRLHEYDKHNLSHQAIWPLSH